MIYMITMWNTRARATLPVRVRQTAGVPCTPGTRNHVSSHSATGHNLSLPQRFPEIPNFHDFSGVETDGDAGSYDSLYSVRQDRPSQTERCTREMQFEPGFENSYELFSETFNFFKCFDDFSKPLVSKAELRAYESHSFPSEVEHLLLECLSKRYSKPVIENCYEQNKKTLERALAGRSVDVSAFDRISEFEDKHAFAERVQIERLLMLRDQQWHIARVCIRGEEQLGYFIPIMCALRQVIEKFGGIQSLKAFSELRNDAGERLYSNQYNCDMMRNAIREEENRDSSLPLVFFSKYCDGTQLAQSGTTESVVMRIRVDNLPKAQGMWFDVGIVPELIIADFPGKSQNLPLLKCELFQRFQFLLLENTGVGSSHLWRDFGFEPRLLCVLCDQPQERLHASLYRSRGKRSCTQCRSTAEQDSLEPSPERVTEHLVAGQLEAAIFDRIDMSKPHVDLCGQILPSQRWKQFLNMSDDYRSGRKAFLKSYLNQERARHFPPSLAILKGIGGKHGQLYNVFGFDKLHVFDLGVGRYFGDNLFKVLKKAEIRGSLTKEKWIHTANMRIFSLSPSTGVHKMEPFKQRASDKQASFTGKERRLLVPFQFHAVIGLNASKTPDNCVLTQTALALDFLQTSLEGINRDVGEREITESDIRNLQSFSKKICLLMRRLLGLEETTKLHRLGAHLGESIRNFGSSSFTDTGVNESKHAGLKKAFQTTNKRKRGLGKQLLQLNIAAELVQSSIRNYNPAKDLYTVENQITDVRELNVKRPRDPHLLKGMFERQMILSEYINKLYQVNSNLDNEQFVSFISRIINKDLPGTGKINVLRTAAIAGRSEWFKKKDVFVRQKLYAGSFKRWASDRHDVVKYEPHSKKILNLQHQPSYDSYGELVCFLRVDTPLSQRRQPDVALIRKMKRTEPQPGNVRIVTEYGFVRLMYSFNHGRADVDLVAIPLLCVNRRVVLYQRYIRYHFAEKLSSDNAVV